MKTAAGVLAVLAWGGLLAAMWYPLAAGVQPPVGVWLGVVATSLLVGLVVPAFLLGLDGTTRGQTKRLPSQGERDDRV